MIRHEPSPVWLFAPFPCSASISKSSACHFRPVCVRILLQHYVLWLMHKLQLKLQFPPLKPWFKCLRLPQLMLRILSKIRLLCRYNFCSFYCLVLPWLVFALSPFPPLCRPRGCLFVPIFSIVFRPLVFIFLSFVRLYFAKADLAGLLCSCLLLHTFYLSCQCASPRKHRVCVVLFSSAPFSLAHLLFVI